ncbi:hypothetical protein OBBRIDRAFT_156753 [Obba rivulosa]|uniref:Uncharacterized protein n=1 Tax=Obba rivulosa TaxID=1052685 RepID=A0A8E2AVJ0_9APHY|nr:hypothetical protein OBBRIDRAFT_156753 [Obba rivulosa]
MDMQLPQCSPALEVRFGHHKYMSTADIDICRSTYSTSCWTSRGFDRSDRVRPHLHPPTSRPRHRHLLANANHPHLLRCPREGRRGPNLRLCCHHRRGGGGRRHRPSQGLNRSRGPLQ